MEEKVFVFGSISIIFSPAVKKRGLNFILWDEEWLACLRHNILPHLIYRIGMATLSHINYVRC